MSFVNIARYIKPNFPVEQSSESSYGFNWEYVGPSDDIAFNKPLIGEVWADGRPVTSYELTPSLENSSVSNLSVSTVVSINGQESANLTPGIIETRFQLTWTTTSLPLRRHPEFRDMDAANLRAVIGWEQEVNEVAKANYQYYSRDADGVASGSPITVSNPDSPAYKYITLRLLGHESYNFPSPNWTKVSVYKSSTLPPLGSVGQKENPKGSGYPAEWEWIKTDFSGERIGGQNRWNVTETWSGYKHVDFDVDEIFV